MPIRIFTLELLDERSQAAVAGNVDKTLLILTPHQAA
jgi:hypothetical protein